MFNAGDPFSALIGGRANGCTYFIMQSDENKQKIIKDIKQSKYSLTFAEILDSAFYGTQRQPGFRQSLIRG